jgi:hypothetical protein
MEPIQGTRGGSGFRGGCGHRENNTLSTLRHVLFLSETIAAGCESSLSPCEECAGKDRGHDWTSVIGEIIILLPNITVSNS